LVGVGAAFVAGAEPSEGVEPGQGAFRDPAQPAQSGAVPGAAAGADRGDAALTQQLAVLVVVVAAVGVELAGASSWPAA
jgi:hypothetical protein